MACAAGSTRTRAVVLAILTAVLFLAAALFFRHELAGTFGTASAPDASGGEGGGGEGDGGEGGESNGGRGDGGEGGQPVGGGGGGVGDGGEGGGEGEGSDGGAGADGGGNDAITDGVEAAGTRTKSAEEEDRPHPEAPDSRDDPDVGEAGADLVEGITPGAGAADPGSTASAAALFLPCVEGETFSGVEGGAALGKFLVGRRFCEFGPGATALDSWVARDLLPWAASGITQRMVAAGAGLGKRSSRVGPGIMGTLTPI